MKNRAFCVASNNAALYGQSVVGNAIAVFRAYLIVSGNASSLHEIAWNTSSVGSVSYSTF